MNKEKLKEMFFEEKKKEFEEFCKKFEDKKFIPKIGEKYWFVGLGVHSKIRNEVDMDFNFMKNTTYFFRTKEEAEKYREFLNDIYDLGKEFDYDELNYYFCYDYDSKKMNLLHSISYKRQRFHFTKENAKTLLEKYGEEYIKNYLLDIWD